MGKTKKRLLRICALILSAALIFGTSACAGMGTVRTGGYFLCSTSGDYEPGVLVYDEKGKTILEQENAYAVCCLKADGTALEPVGKVPKNSYLFIAFDESRTGVSAGLWSVKNQEWTLEPQAGMRKCLPIDGVVRSLTVGGNTYYLDEYAENAYSREDYDSFSFQDGLILKNARTLDEGDCIEDADGEIYLTGREFYKKNRNLGVLEADNGTIHIAYSVSDNAMVVKYEYAKSVGFSAGFVEEFEPCAKYYLCDIQGRLAEPVAVYDYVRECVNWPYYGKARFLELQKITDTDEVETVYLNVSSGKFVDFPKGYQEEDILYSHEQYFGLYDGKTCTIYDGETERTGASFTADQPYEGTIIGLNSYIINGQEKTIVINGKVYKYGPDAQIRLIQESPYAVICAEEQEKRNVYIVDPQEQVILETDQNVLYADETHYLVLEDDNTYKICTY